jgi:hypothetical protein
MTSNTKLSKDDAAHLSAADLEHLLVKTDAELAKCTHLTREELLRRYIVVAFGPIIRRLNEFDQRTRQMCAKQPIETLTPQTDRPASK